MPSDRQTRRQRHQAAIKPQRGKAIRGAQSTEFVKNSGYRKSEFIGGKKYYIPMSTDPKSSGAGGDVTNITLSGGSGINNAVLSDGTVPFNAKQFGVSPTESQHLATKAYVDDTSANTTWTLSDGTTTQAVVGGNTVTVVDGTAINAVVSATDTLTINNTGVASAVAGSGISVSAGTGDVTVSNTGVTSNVAGSGIGVSSGTGAVTVSNTGVLSNLSGNGITLSGSTGNVTITNSGVLSITGGTSLDASASTGAVTLGVTADSIGDTQLTYNTGQHLTTTSAPTFATVNTGQGANELYAMNQNVRTTDNVQFGDIIVDGDDITSNPFSSGFTGGGWKIDNTAHAEFSSASIRGTLSVYELLLQQLRATNGSVIITAVAKVESIDGSDITFEDPSDNGVCPFHDNDIVMVQRADLTGTSGADNGGGTLDIIRRIVRRVTSVSGRTITVSSAEDGDLPADTGSFGVGDDVVRIGNTTNTNRDAILYLSADDSKAPYLVIKDGVNSWANWGSASTEKARLGRLDGITDTDAGLSGSQSNLYGLYSDSVYLKGHIFANSGSIGGISMASSKLYTGTGTFNNANTGVYIDSSSNFSLGNKLAWNNSVLAIDGSVTIGGSTASVVVSGAASGATANQASTASILSGNLTGTVDGAAAGTVKSGAAAGGTANQDSTGTIQASGDKTSGTTGGWTINSDAIFTGTKTTTGYTANGHITFTSNGEIHTPTFYVESNGSSAFKGTLTIGSTNLTETNTFNSNTTAANVGLGNVDNQSASTIQAGTTKANVGLGNVDNTSDSTQQTNILSAASKSDVGLSNVDNTSDSSVLGTAATAANNATKTSGYVGGWQINSTSILGIADGAAQIVMTASGNIATGQWSINRDGSASFADGGITFATNGDITSNTFLLERTRLFGAGEDGTCTLYAGTVESTYEGGNNTNQVNSQHGESIITRSGNTWSMQGDCYFDTLTISAAGGALTLVTNGFRLFVKNTFTIASSCYVSCNGSRPSGWDDGDAYGGGSANGTLSRGAQGHSGGSAGSATGGGGDGGRGGAAGGGGGIVFISARIISNSGYIHAKGGDGHAGQQGDSS